VFETLIVIVIVVNAVMLGLETFDTVVAGYDHAFDVAYNVILAVYVIELLIRLTASGWDVREFVKNHWNVFDFVVIAASFAPGLRATAMLLRLVRLARIVRIIRVPARSARRHRRHRLVVNLFIGIVLNSMEEARAVDRAKHETDDLLDRFAVGAPSARGCRTGTAALTPRRSEMNGARRGLYK
jgi:hypothetical protein